jgi:hypothetical protein
MTAVDDVSWFRRPTQDAGTLNACYNALDVHVVRGRADAPALATADRVLTCSQLLAEVGAFAGVLRALGVTPGVAVAVHDLPPAEGVVAELACARLGAVLWRGGALVDLVDSAEPHVLLLGTATPLADARWTPGTTLTADTTGELDWATAMRAGRTDPAGCADVPADQPLRVVDGVPVPTAAHLLAVLAGEVLDPVLTPLLAGQPVDVRGVR